MAACGVAVLFAIAFAACGSDDDGGSGTAGVGENCEPAHSFETVEDGTLTAVMAVYPPYGYTEDGEAAGIDGEIIARFAEENCLEVKASDADATGIPAMVESGRADVSGGDWWRSKDRQEVVAMSDPTYLDEFSVVSTEGLDTIESLEGRTIGDQAGSFWAEDAKEVFGDDYKLYRRQDQVMQDLKSGRIEVAFSTPGSAAYYADQVGLEGYQVKVLQPDPRFPSAEEPPQSGIMTSLDNPELTEALSATVAAMKEDGTLAEIVEEHGLPASAVKTGPARFF